MRHTQLRLIIVLVCSILMLSLLFSFILTRPVPLTDYFELHEDELVKIAETLYQNKPDGFPILLDKPSDIQQKISNSIPDDVMSYIRAVFSDAQCDQIYGSTTRSGIYYCKFICYGRYKNTGIAFVGNITDPRLCFFGLLVAECTFISDGWVYFEYYTPLGEKQIPG